MHPHLAVAALAAAAVLPAQDFLLYKFDSGCTAEAINYATGPAAFAGNGVIETTLGSPWVPGVFNSGLSGGNATTGAYARVRSGWMPSLAPLSGDLTVAFWARERTPPGTALNYLSGTSAAGGHRLFTNGIANRGLYQRNIVSSGPTGVDVALPDTAADFQTLTAAGWVHIALVVDSVAATAEWFVNGASVHVIAGVGGGLINSSGEYLVNFQASSNESNYDIDDYLLSNRAYAAAEILQLSLAPRAGHGPYLSGTPGTCGSARLEGAGGAPVLGNAGYGIELETTATGFYVLLFGFTRCSLGGAIPLPIDAGTLTPLASGCWLLTDPIGNSSGVAAGVPVTTPLPIPMSGVFSGFNLYCQAALLDAVTSRLHVTNGLGVSIGL